MPSSGFQTCALDRKSTRLNSSHTLISYAVFCLKKKILGRIHVLGILDAALVHRIAEFPDTCLRLPRRRLLTPNPLLPSRLTLVVCFFFNDRAPPEIYPLPLHDVLPI